MTRSTSPDPRWRDAMTGLLYPAVLGTLIYLFAERFYEHRRELLDSHAWVGLALLLLFALDFLHSMKESTPAYGPFEFVFDFCIVLALLLAGKAWQAEAADSAPALDFIGWLALARALGVVFEFVHSELWQPASFMDRLYNVRTDLGPALVYGLLWLLQRERIIVAVGAGWLLALMAADALLYVVHVAAPQRRAR
jgi:hypothetical protein